MSSFLLKPEQLQALQAVCDAILPTIEVASDPTNYWKRNANDLHIPEKIIDLVAQLPEDEQNEFKQLLNLLKSSLLGITWFGPMLSVTRLKPEQTEKLLQSWSQSKLPALRKAFITFKKIICFVYFGYSESNQPNPNWEAIGYPGPLLDSPLQYNDYLKTINIDAKTKLTCDVLVIGSGAGGAVVAAELAKKGKKVLIVDKGAYITEQEMTQREVEMMGKLMEKKGVLTNQDGSMTIMAGSCIGGGTTVNWSASLRLPDQILHEWATEHEIPELLEPEFKSAFEIIEQHLNINTKHSIHNQPNQLLVNATQKLGYRAALIPRNNYPQPNSNENEADYLQRAGFGALGDVYRNKQSTPITFLTDAQAHDADILPNTHVERIVINKDEAVGAIAIYTNPVTNEQFRVRIKADKVVVAAGAIHTPAILKRSGLIHPHIGRHLFLHPTSAVVGRYNHRIDPWYGPMMTALCDEFAFLTDNYGFRIEVPPAHSGLMGMALPWQSGKQLKNDMLNIAHFAPFIALVRDKYTGRIVLDKQNQPIIQYNLHNYDKNHLVRGLEEAVKLHVAAGATEIITPHTQALRFNPATDSLKKFIEQMRNAAWEPNRFILFSAHQMGTCRMGGRDKHHCLKPNGETREVRNLFVADASAFPQCSGVNPMLTIQALAWFIAQQLYV